MLWPPLPSCPSSFILLPLLSSPLLRLTVLLVIVCLPHCFDFSFVVSWHKSHKGRRISRQLSHHVGKKMERWAEAEIISKGSSFNWQQIARLNRVLNKTSVSLWVWLPFVGGLVNLTIIWGSSRSANKTNQKFREWELSNEWRIHII